VTKNLGLWGRGAVERRRWPAPRSATRIVRVRPGWPKPQKPPHLKR